MIRRADLINTLVRDTGLDRNLVSMVVQTILEEWRDSILRGEEIEIVGLGWLRLHMHWIQQPTECRVLRRLQFRANPLMKARMRRLTLDRDGEIIKKVKIVVPSSDTGDFGSG